MFVLPNPFGDIIVLSENIAKQILKCVQFNTGYSTDTVIVA